MSKGRLTNLCQEDKGRIGELIRTLASERQQRLEVQEGSEKWEKQATAIKSKFQKSLKLIALYQRELKRVRQLQPVDPPPHSAIASSSPAATSPTTDSSGQHCCTKPVVANPTVETLVQTDPILEPIGVQTDPEVFGADKYPRRMARLRSPSPGVPLPLGRKEESRERSTSSKRQHARHPVSDSDESNSSWQAHDTQTNRRARISARGASTLKPSQLSLLHRYLKIQNEKRPIPGSPPTFASRSDINTPEAPCSYVWQQSSFSSNDDGRSRASSKHTPDFGKRFSCHESVLKPHFETAYADSSPRHAKRESPSGYPRRPSPEDSDRGAEGRRRNGVRRASSRPDEESDVASPLLCSSADHRNVYSSDENTRGGSQPHGNLSSWTSSDSTVWNAPSPLRRNQYRQPAELHSAEDPSRSFPRPHGGAQHNPSSSSDRPNSSRDADDEKSGEQRNDSSSSLGVKSVKDSNQRLHNPLNFRVNKSHPLTPVAEFAESTMDTLDHNHHHHHHSHKSSAVLPQNHNTRFGEQHGPLRPQGRGWSYRRGNLAQSSSDDREISSIAESHELANVVSTSVEHRLPLPEEQKQARQVATEGSTAAPLAPVSSLKSSTADGPASRARDVRVSWDVDTTSREVSATQSVKPPFPRDPSPYNSRAFPEPAPTTVPCSTTSAQPIPPLHSAAPVVPALTEGKPVTAENDSVLQASPDIRHSILGRPMDGDGPLRQSLPFLSDGFYERSMFSVIDSLEEDTHNHMRSLDAQLRRLEEHVYGMRPEELTSSRGSHHVLSAPLQPSCVSSHGQMSAHEPILPVAPTRCRTPPLARILREERRVGKEDLEMSLRAAGISGTHSGVHSGVNSGVHSRLHSGVHSPALEEVDRVLELLELN